MKMYQGRKIAGIARVNTEESRICNRGNGHSDPFWFKKSQIVKDNRTGEFLFSRHGVFGTFWVRVENEILVLLGLAEFSLVYSIYTGGLKFGTLQEMKKKYEDYGLISSEGVLVVMWE